VRTSAPRWVCGVVVAMGAMTTVGCGSTVQGSFDGARGDDVNTIPTSERIGHGDGPSGRPPDGVTGRSPGTGGAAEGGAGRAPATTGEGHSAPLPSTASAERGPIRLGFISFSSAAQKIGADNGQTFTVQNVEKALVAQLNAQGGLAGRRIVAHYENIDGASSDYSTQLQAACSAFSQDHDVAAVLGLIGFYSESFEKCLTDAKTPHVSGDWNAGDTTNYARFPLLFTPTAVSLDRRMETMLTRLSAAGDISAQHRLGVVLESCPQSERAFSRTFVPTARRLGLDLAETHRFDCLNGLDDAGGGSAQATNAVLRFSARGVDRVTFVSNDPSAALFFILAAQQQGYHPHYLMSSVDVPQVLAPNLDSEALQNIHGVGWLPATDVLRPGKATSAGQRCLALVARGGIHASSPLDYLSAYAVCDSVFLLERMLQLTQGHADAAALSAAARSSGLGFGGASVHGGVTAFGQRRDGPARGALFGFDRACSCLAYRGSAFAF